MRTYHSKDLQDLAAISPELEVKENTLIVTANDFDYTEEFNEQDLFDSEFSDTK